jgi:hypothetical protein
VGVAEQALKPKLARLLAEVELAGANLSKKGGSSSDESGEGVSADSAAEDSKVCPDVHLCALLSCLLYHVKWLLPRPALDPPGQS